MSDSSTSAIPTELAQRVAQLENEAADLESAWNRSRITNRWLLLLSVGLVTGVLWKSYETVSQVRDKRWQEQVILILQENSPEHRQLFRNELREIWNQVEPDLVNDFRVQIQEDSPAIEKAFLVQRDEFEKNIKTKLQRAVLANYRKTLDRNVELLNREFPKLRDKALRDRVISRTLAAIEQLIDKHYMAPLESELQELYASYQEFPVADPSVTGSGDDTPAMRFLWQMLKLLKLKLISAPDQTTAP